MAMCYVLVLEVRTGTQIQRNGRKNARSVGGGGRVRQTGR